MNACSFGIFLTGPSSDTILYFSHLAKICYKSELAQICIGRPNPTHLWNVKFNVWVPRKWSKKVKKSKVKSNINLAIFVTLRFFVCVCKFLFPLKNSRSPDLSGQSTTLSHLLSISTHVPSKQLNSEMLQALKLNSRRKTLESKLLFLLLLIGGGCSLQMPKK